MSEEIKIKNILEERYKLKFVVRLGELPKYATEGSAGLDLKSAENFILQPMQRKLVDTGLKVQIPLGFEGQIRPRSGLAYKHGITVLNSPGTIDCVPSYQNIKTTEGNKTIQEILDNEDFEIISWNENKKIEEVDEIKEIWEVGEKEVIKISFNDNTEIFCTKNQLILTKNGWKKAAELTEEDEIVNPL
ncbi:MAG: hypothetical protein ACOC1O_01365 [bacterium]